MKTARRIAVAILFLLVAFAAVLGVNTYRYQPPEVTEAEPTELGVDIDRAADTLARAIRYQTISDDLTRPDFEAFLGFLDDAFPTFTATTERVILEANTPLYLWKGRDDSLQPVLLAAHYDVVPIPPGSLSRWTHDPFAGVVDEAYIWGRGTLDNKGALIAMVIAAEHMMESGFRPERDIYFSFGGDEEIGGRGAASVAKHFNDKGIRLAWALDEGSFVLDKIIPGLQQPVASINIAEKGYLTLRIVATAAGGHSSMPPRQTAVGQLARAIDRLQDNPVPGGLTGVSEEFFDALGRYFSIEQRAVFANRWLFDPVLRNILSASPSTDAMLRTTTAPTMLSGSSTENVLPTRATATVNFRLHPRDSIEDVVEHVRTVIDDDRIKIEVDETAASPASPVSGVDTDGYRDIEASIRAAFGPVATVPGLTIAATDARHYAKAADAAYRINPFMITGVDLVLFHGINERLSIENLERGINFFGALIGKQ